MLINIHHFPEIGISVWMRFPKWIQPSPSGGRHDCNEFCQLQIYFDPKGVGSTHYIYDIRYDEMRVATVSQVTRNMTWWNVAFCSIG